MPKMVDMMSAHLNLSYTFVQDQGNKRGGKKGWEGNRNEGREDGVGGDWRETENNITKRIMQVCNLQLWFLSQKLAI